MRKGQQEKARVAQVGAITSSTPSADCDAFINADGCAHQFTHERNCLLQDILLYVPNIVGYVRLVLLTLAVAAGNQHLYHTAFHLLVVNFGLDAVDGILARALHQVRIAVWSPGLLSMAGLSATKS